MTEKIDRIISEIKEELRNRLAPFPEARTDRVLKRVFTSELAILDKVKKKWDETE